MSKKLFYTVFICISSLYALQGQISSLENIEDWEKGSLKKSLKSFLKDFYTFGDPFQMGGGVFLNLRSYGSNGSTLRQDPFFYTLGANLNFKVYQIDIPFSVMMTAKNTSKSYPSIKDLVNSLKEQAKSKVNGYARFGISPHYKWAKLHLGHRSMNFSKHTLSNLNFYGAGVELSPDKFKFSAMFGRLAKAEPINLSLTTPNLPIYKRIGWSTKFGFGDDQASADIILFTAKDDENSLTIPGTYPKQVSPEANFALGVQLQKLFLKKIRIKLDFTRSGTSPNLLDAQSNTKSLTDFILKKRNTSFYGNALEGSLGFEGKSINAGVLVNRVDDKFRTFGAYFFNRDIMDIQGFANFGLIQNKLNSSVKAGIQSNNLDGSKSSTTRRLIYDVQTSWSEEAFNAQFNYSNNSSSVEYILNQQLDSLNAVVVTQDLGLNLSYTLPLKGENTHSLTLNGNIQDVSDDIEKPNRVSVSKLYLANLGYAVRTKSKWTLMTRVNYTINKVLITDLTRIGLGASVQKAIFKEKVNMGLTCNYYNNKNKSGLNSSNSSVQLSLGTKLFKGLNLQFGWGLLHTASDTAPSFTENIGNLGIQYSFNYTPNRKKSK
ncbi:MAG: hypothetical protein IT267_00270 [Saprospiraceae bacterium]|nr:hypothetical protein [Saprospiraceae bacterium]